MPPKSRTRRGTRKLSEVAKHLVLPSGIVSTGYPAVEAQCAKMGVVHDEWQAGLGRAMLSKRADGSYAAGIGGVLISICRQVGKTFTVGSIIFALCVLFPGLKVLWTAHRTRTSDETFRSLAGFARRKLVAPYMLPSRAANGQQEIRFKNGSRILFGARETGFGRGFDDVDIEVFDECQILTQRALDDMVPATNVAKNPLLIFMGTPPKPTDPSEMFSSRRAEALAIKKKQEAAGLAAVSCDMLWVEVGADEDADPDDREQIEKANPSYPHRTTEAAIRRLRKILADDDSFKREGMGIWDPSDSPRVIDEVSWGRVADSASMPLERLTLAVDVAPDRAVSSVSLAGLRADGKWHVELDDQRKGTEWVPAWVASRAERNRLHAVVVDEMSGLVERRNGRVYLAGTDVQVTLASAEGRDMAIACGKFFDAVMESKLRHTDQPQLNVALSVARKRPLAGAWAWNRKDAGSDITPIVSATLALWGAQKDDVARPWRRRTGDRTAVVL